MISLQEQFLKKVQVFKMYKKLAFFPATRDACAIARHQSLLQGYTLSHLFMPDFMNLTNKDIHYIDGGDKNVAFLSNLCESNIASCDTLFLDYDANMDDIALYQDAINMANNLNKKTIISKLLKHRIEDEPIGWPSDSPMNENSLEDQLYEIRVPVVMIFSQGSFSDQFAVELAVREHFINAGYKVSQIGSVEASQFLGFSSFPQFIYENRDAYEKIIKLNKYMKNLVDQEESDLLVIGVPGAILKYNDKILNGLGIMPLIVSSAVAGDVSIICMHYSTYKMEYFEQISLLGQYRLGLPIQFFNIANVTLAPDMSSDMLKMDYLHLNSEFVLDGVNQFINSSDHYVFNALNMESSNRACIALQETLANNAHYMI